MQETVWPKKPRGHTEKDYCPQKLRIQEEAGPIHNEPHDRRSNQGTNKEPWEQRGYLILIARL